MKIRDRLLKLLFIPLLGIVISYVSGVITYSKYSIPELFGCLLYFVFVSFCIWKGCQWIHLKVRKLYSVNQSLFSKIASVCTVSGLYGTAISGILCFIWFRISKEEFSWTKTMQLVSFSVLAVIIFTVLYEVLYLTKEREEDTEKVEQLDYELTKAEAMSLRNKLDPHFIFNSLTALSYLISNDPLKADQFNRKLAEVYKYFLINREKEFITLEKEIHFVEDYFFLLSIRHDYKLQLMLDITEADAKQFLVIPYTLQILIENAIKHNEFNREHPLSINISIADRFLIVTNTKARKKLQRESTGNGLNNLGIQYRLLTRSNIEITDAEEKFTVKLPLQPTVTMEMSKA
jgi:two-component system, LytTR family, sensor kinase